MGELYFTKNTGGCLLADRIKITLKMGVIASILVGVIWSCHSRITVLETNYQHVCQTLNEMKEMIKEIRQYQIER